MLLKAGVRTCD